MFSPSHRLRSMPSNDPRSRTLIFDAHLDLAMNALEWNRDLTRPIEEIRARETALKDKPDRGQGTVCFPELRRGGIGLCVATLIARLEHGAYSPVFGWRSPAQAWAMTQGQLAWYRALVPHQRQLSDEQIKALIQRDAVIGGALDAWMRVPGWVRGQTTPQTAGVRLAQLVAHLDHICQLAGNARHVGIGSDLDGAFGREQTAGDLDTIADLAALPTLLAERGFAPEDIRAVMHGNFLRFLRDTWAPNRTTGVAPFRSH